MRTSITQNLEDLKSFQEQERSKVSTWPHPCALWDREEDESCRNISPIFHFHGDVIIVSIIHFIHMVQYSKKKANSAAPILTWEIVNFPGDLSVQTAAPKVPP